MMRDWILKKNKGAGSSREIYIRKGGSPGNNKINIINLSKVAGRIGAGVKKNIWIVGYSENGKIKSEYFKTKMLAERFIRKLRRKK